MPHDSWMDMVINDQWRALSDQYIKEELMEQPLFALLRQEDPLSNAGHVSLEDVQERLCILVTSPEQRENEAAHWRDVMGLQSSQNARKSELIPRVFLFRI